MSSNKTADLPRQNQKPVTAAEWFAGGQRIWYDPAVARVLTGHQPAARGLTGHETAAAPGALRVFERVKPGDYPYSTFARHGVSIPATDDMTP